MAVRVGIMWLLAEFSRYTDAACRSVTGLELQQERNVGLMRLKDPVHDSSTLHITAEINITGSCPANQQGCELYSMQVVSRVSAVFAI